MIGIRAIATYTPSSGLNNIQQGYSFGMTEAFIRDKIGAVHLPRKDADEETSDMAIKALNRLRDKVSEPLNHIQALVLVTQNGDGEGLPQTSAIIQNKAKLRNDVATFDLSHGCAGYIYGLSVLSSFMDAQRFHNGVLLTCDPYSKILDHTDRNTCLLFGDAATATWLSASAGWVIGSSLYYTDGSGAEYLMVKDGKLKMNGRQIFNFAVSRVPRLIREILESSGVTPEDIDIFCLHQGSASLVREIAKKFPEVEDRFVLNLYNTGNTVSSSIPILLESLLDNPRVNRILIAGFGVGLSAACTILERSGLKL